MSTSSTHATHRRSAGSDSTHRLSELLMRSGVVATCADCGDERLFVPVDDLAGPGEFCCTTCDAAVFLLAVADPALHASASRVA